jgi:hypothetical protein
MASENANSSLNEVGHGGDNKKTGYVDAAENLFVNSQLWMIDFVHVATGKCVDFAAFITEFADSFTSNWSEESVYGRMDPIMTFQNTQRKISLGWTVVSTDEHEAEKNLHKFEHLSSMLYPTYKDRQKENNAGSPTMNASPLMRVKFTNLILDANSAGSPSPAAIDSGLLGAINGFTLTPNLDQGFFCPSPGTLLPKEYSVSCQITVLHTHELGWKESSNAWMAKNDKFPYGQHKLTGPHSTCKQGLFKREGRKTKSKTNRNIGNAQAIIALRPFMGG